MEVLQLEKIINLKTTQLIFNIIFSFLPSSINHLKTTQLIFNNEYWKTRLNKK